MVGDYLGREAPVFGGINLMGEPGSPARESLIPGHRVLGATVGGIAALMLATSLMLVGRGESVRPEGKRRELPSKIDFPK